MKKWAYYDELKNELEVGVDCQCSLSASIAIPFLSRERLNNEVNFEKAEPHVAASLREGANLRLKVAGNCGRQIVEAAVLIGDCLVAGGKLLLFGNGISNGFPGQT
jgi:hypothetical protein